MQPDFNKMMRDAQKAMQKMQQDMAQAQQDLSVATVEGSSGGGAVKITCNGALDFKSVKIKPEAVDPADVETLEDLVLAAVQDASEKAKKLAEDKTASITKGMNLPPGLGF